jgi:plastocyanin
VTATNITFEQADLEVAAATPFTLELVNNDASVPHNVEIRDQAGTPVFNTETFPGVETRSFDAPALTAGPYQFVCTVHPNMIIDVNAT